MYTILSAQLANAEGTAAVLLTQEAGAVLASAKDTPDLWAAMNASAKPTAYAPAKPVPVSVTRFQARAALLQAGLLTQAQTAVSAADELTKLAWADAQEFLRTSPTVTKMGAAMGLTSAQLDQLFLVAVEIKA